MSADSLSDRIQLAARAHSCGWTVPSQQPAHNYTRYMRPVELEPAELLVKRDAVTVRTSSDIAINGEAKDL